MIVNQPQGQGGLSTFEFKDNVTGLDFCATDDGLTLKKCHRYREWPINFGL